MWLSNQKENYCSKALFKSKCSELRENRKQKHLIEFITKSEENANNLPPQAPSSTANTSQYAIRNSRNHSSNKSSKSPSPALKSSRSSPISIHFHKCENKSCLSSSNKEETESGYCGMPHSPSQSSIGSFTSERRILINSNRNHESPKHPDVKFKIKLLPELEKAESEFAYPVRRELAKHRSCSVTSSIPRSSSCYEERLLGSSSQSSPFTYIETVSIQNAPSKKINRTHRSQIRAHECSRSLRSTPVRPVCIKPDERFRTIFFAKVNSHLDNNNAVIIVLKMWKFFFCFFCLLSCSRGPKS